MNGRGEGASCEDKDGFFGNRKSGEQGVNFVKWMRRSVVEDNGVRFYRVFPAVFFTAGIAVLGG